MAVVEEDRTVPEEQEDRMAPEEAVEGVEEEEVEGRAIM